MILLVYMKVKIFRKLLTFGLFNQFLRNIVYGLVEVKFNSKLSTIADKLRVQQEFRLFSRFHFPIDHSN